MQAGTCIVSDAFQQQLREQVLSEARQAAESAQQQRRATIKPASASQPSAGQQKLSNSKSGEGSTSEEGCMQPLQVPQPHWVHGTVGSAYSGWSSSIDVLQTPSIDAQQAQYTLSRLAQQIPSPALLSQTAYALQCQQASAKLACL